jgi:hypothetical protein
MKSLVSAAAALLLAMTLTAAGPLCPATSHPMGKSGCCSHHGGVCGCNKGNGMQQCCDGATSPSCRCGQ